MIETLRNLLDPARGGKVRAVIVTLIAILTWVLQFLDQVDWEAGLVASLPALVQLVTHFSRLGNRTP